LRAALVLVAACFSPAPPEGSPCTADKTCPDPLICSFGTCVAEVPPCTPIDDGSGKLTVPTVTSPIALDGDLGDWPTCFVTVDATTAGLVRDMGANGKYAAGRFSLAADATHLYIAAECSIVAPLGDQPPPAVYQNNSISVYFDADGVFTTAKYDADAAQIVVDHANQEQAFHSGSLLDSVGVTSGATVGDTTFTIEMAVEPATFGATSFADTIGFDIGLVGGDGAEMTSELVWFQACAPPACGCTNGDAAPFCDAREFGTATFMR